MNSPESLTLSGDAAAVDQLLEHLQQQGTFARRLKTDGRAYHSHHMSQLGQEYEDLLVSSMSSLSMLDRPASDILWISSGTGQLVSEAPKPGYWRTNLVSPVLFASAIEALLQSSSYHFFEVGPYSALELPIKQTRTTLRISESKIHYFSAMYRGKNSITTMLTLLGELHLHGYDIAFYRINHVSSSTSGLYKPGHPAQPVPREVFG